MHRHAHAQTDEEIKGEDSVKLTTSRKASKVFMCVFTTRIRPGHCGSPLLLQGRRGEEKKINGGEVLREEEGNTENRKRKKKNIEKKKKKTQ